MAAADQKQTHAVKLNTGALMPLVGLGTWKSQPGEVGAAVIAAVKAGYRHLDCAAIYANEAEVGAALKTLFEEGVCRREDLFITSKLWNTEHGKGNVIPALKKTLADLGLDYLDLYLIHWSTAFAKVTKDGQPQPFPLDDNGKVIPPNPLPPLTETWAEMEAAYKQGLAKAIGVSNFNRKQLEAILEVCEVVPAQNQIESHPMFPNEALIQFGKSKGIQATAYSPLGSNDRPVVLQDDPVLLEQPALLEVAKKHGKSPAQVLIRWQIEREVVVLPKSVNPARIQQNLDVFDFKLDAEDMAALAKLDRGRDGRLCDPKFVKEDKVIFMMDEHPEYAFAAEY